MNLVLIDREELRSDGTCVLSDRRAAHLRSVLGVEVGSTVRWSDAKGVGLQFDGLRARDVWALNEYFTQLGSP